MSANELQIGSKSEEGISPIYSILKPKLIIFKPGKRMPCFIVLHRSAG